MFLPLIPTGFSEKEDMQENAAHSDEHAKHAPAL